MLRFVCTVQRIIAIAMLFTFYSAESISVSALEEIAPRQVIEESNARSSFLKLDEQKDVVALMQITLIDGNGKADDSKKIAYCRKDSDRSTKAIFSILAPADLKGSGLLTWNYDDERQPDDQWGYAPSIEQVRRVSAPQKNESFMEGTDFTYSDLGDWEMDDYDYAHLPPEVIDGIACYHVELRSKNAAVIEKTNYARMEIWVRPDIWLYVKIRFDDKDLKPLKELRLGDVEQIDGFWTPKTFHIINLQTRHETTAIFSHIRYNVGLDEGMFSPRRLTKGEPCFRFE